LTERETAADNRPVPVPYRADQIGSLTRPPQLKHARAAYGAGQVTHAQLRTVEDRAILDALEHQRQVGMPILTDGEMRRAAWQTDLSDAVDGFVADYPVVRTTLPDGTVREIEMHTKAVEAKLRPKRRLTATFLPFLEQHAAGPFTVTLPSPASAARGSFKAGVTDRVYASRTELLADLVQIYQDELRALDRDGVGYVQMDEGFNSYVNPAWRAALEQDGHDPERWLAEDIAAENACWALLPAERVVRASHLCRGSRTATRGQGSYDWLAERLFNELEVERFLFEYDSDAAGGFEPLRFLPPGKIVVLGLITSKDARLEDQAMLMRRIDQASTYAPIEQLALSPQCGFGGSADNAFMTADEQWRKLELVVDTARKGWG
jgi:5-methyltetrahydropteroyltriglutamate--homocysteine methyltransferase